MENNEPVLRNNIPKRPAPSKRMSFQVEPKFFNELSAMIPNNNPARKFNKAESVVPPKPPGRPPPVPGDNNNNNHGSGLLKKPSVQPPTLPPRFTSSLALPPKNSHPPSSPSSSSPHVADNGTKLLKRELSAPISKQTKGGMNSASQEVKVGFTDDQTFYTLEIMPLITTAKAARSMLLTKLPSIPSIKYLDSFHFYRIDPLTSSYQLIPDSELLLSSKSSISSSSSSLSLSNLAQTPSNDEVVLVLSKKETVESLQKKPSSSRFASLRGNRASTPDSSDNFSQSFLLHLLKQHSSPSPSSSSSSSSSSSPAPSPSLLPISVLPKQVENVQLSPRTSISSDMDQVKLIENPIGELISSEGSFIWEVDLILQHFVKDLLEKSILPPRTIADLFLNLEAISKLHKELFRRLQQDSSIGGISSLFEGEMMKEIERVYTIYLGYYEQALSLFYSLRDKSSNFSKFLTKVTDNPMLKDKTLKNLLVCPMQRISRYEMLLNCIVIREKKRGESEEKLKQIVTNANSLSATLLRIDQKRSEADKWASVIKLEEKLLTSEPLRKRGRYIAKEAEFTVYNMLQNDEALRCYVVLFNDLFLRAKVQKKIHRVLEMTPLKQYVMFDKQCQFCNDRSINIASLDPRGHVLRLELADKKEKERWTSSFEKLTAKQERLSKQWEMGSDIELGTLLAADQCQWDAAYVQHCRIFITSRHLLLAWEAFGSWEREAIPLRDIASASIQPNESKLILNTTNWKSSYTFTGLRRLTQTHEILETAMLEQAVMEAKGVSIKGFEVNVKKEEMKKVDTSYNPCCDLQFLNISDEEWSNIWNGDEVAYKAGEVILEHDTKTSNLYQVVTGSVIITSISDTICGTLVAGAFFGLSNFLNATPSNYNFICGEEGASVITISRPIVLQHLKDEPVLLGKFFALLSCRMSDFYQMLAQAHKKERKEKAKKLGKDKRKKVRKMSING